MAYQVTVTWNRPPQASFVDGKYSRAHTWHFDGGIELPASASPHIVPLPFSVESAVDPEEAFVASISSCHMLWFLSIAAKKNFIIDHYEDHAEGILKKNLDGKLAVTRVTLHPSVIFSGSLIPTRDQINELHHLAHEECFIAASVKTEITVIPS